MSTPRAAESVHVFEVPLGGGRAVVLSLPMPQLESSRLTPAERTVALLAASGLSTRAIAARRGASVRTVSNQLALIYEKLAVSSRIELAAKLSKGSE